MWRGRLPHWRADDVTYYATFRFRRALLDSERATLLRTLLQPQGKRFDADLIAVGVETAEMIFRVRKDARGENYELSKVLEKAKQKAGKLIIARSGERFPPFYLESYDRIIRDDAEYEERWLAIVEALAEEEDFLWIAPR